MRRLRFFRSGSGESAIIIPETPTQWRQLGLILTYIAKLNGGTFGSSAPDLTVTDGTYGATKFYDSQASSGGSGATYLTPTNIMPGETTLAGNTRHLFANNSLITRDWTTNVRGILLNSANTKVGVYDRTGGGEITDQPNHFALTLLGRDITPADKAAKYFRIEGNSYTDTHVDTTGVGVRVAGSGQVVRGVWTKGCTYGVYDDGGNRIEDSYFEDCIRVWDEPDQLGYGGVGYFNPGTNSGGSFVRNTIHNPGEDGIWICGSTYVPANFKLSDVVVRNYTAGQLSNRQHCDIAQLGGVNVSSFIFRRVIAEHAVQEIILPSRVSPFSDGPIGAGLQIGDGTHTTGTAAGSIFEDVCILSNHNCLNIAQNQLGMSVNRFIGLMQRHSQLFDNNGNRNTCFPINSSAKAVGSANSMAVHMNPATGDALFSSPGDFVLSNWQQNP